MARVPSVSDRWRPSKPPKFRRRWQRNADLNSKRIPDEAAATRARVERLEKAVAALGETESTEAKSLLNALKAAPRAARERPVTTQVEECQAFIKRSQTQLQRFGARKRRGAEAIRCSGGTVEPIEGRHHASGSTTAATDGVCSSHRAQARGRTPPVEVSRCRTGVRAGGMAEEAYAIFVSTFSRHANGTKALSLSLSDGVECFTRPASGQDRGSRMEALISRGSSLFHQFRSVQSLGLTAWCHAKPAKRRLVRVTDCGGTSW